MVLRALLAAHFTGKKTEAFGWLSERQEEVRKKVFGSEAEAMWKRESAVQGMGTPLEPQPVIMGC